MSAASGHQGLWTEPRFSGDIVRLLSLTRNGEAGRICIAHHGEFVRVESYLPGIENGGKVIPEKQTHYRHGDPADNTFDEYVQEAYAEFWQRDYKDERDEQKS